MEVEILENSVVIKSYPFYNVFNKAREIIAHEIDFIKIDSDPILLCVSREEIIFISKKNEAEISHFAHKKNIELSNKEDVWRLICYPFFDEHITAESLLENEKKLDLMSFEKTEVIHIRKKISSTIKLWLMLTMENESLNHYDVLMARKRFCFLNPFFKSFYQYTMNIALKGYGIKKLTNEYK